jgi:hypothetical protein
MKTKLEREIQLEGEIERMINQHKKDCENTLYAWLREVNVSKEYIQETTDALYREIDELDIKIKALVESKVLELKSQIEQTPYYNTSLLLTEHIRQVLNSF